MNPLVRLRRWAGDRTVEVCLHHIAAGEASPVSHADDPARSRMPLDAHRVLVRDLRAASPPPSLSGTAFTLARHRSEVRDFEDSEEVQKVYLPEMERLLAQLVGAERAFALARPVLRAQSHDRSYGPGLSSGSTARVAHVDYTSRSVRPAAHAAAQRHGIQVPPGARVAAFTLWRALTPPPQDWPLALCEPESVRDEDLVVGRSYGDAGGALYESEFQLLRPSPRHRWGWFPNLELEDVVVFRQHDSALPGPSACPHAAFENPFCPKGALSRRSLEVRAFVIGG